MTNEPADIRVVRGAPTDAELAAAIAVVNSALAAAQVEAAANAKRRPAKSSWNRNHGMLRSTIQSGHGQWVASVQDGLN